MVNEDMGDWRLEVVVMRHEIDMAHLILLFLLFIDHCLLHLRYPWIMLLSFSHT